MGIMRKEFTFISSNERDAVYGCVWLEDSHERYRGILQIAHDLCEHILCYEEFAVYFAAQGFIVLGNDHVGHGRSVKDSAELGHFGEGLDTWRYMVKDLCLAAEICRQKFPGLPHFLIGCGFGACLARQYSKEYGQKLAGAVYIGFGEKNRYTEDFALAAAAKAASFQESTPARDMAYMVYGVYTARCQEKRTDFDWLCSDTQVIDRYIKDDLCGFCLTYEGFRDMFRLINQVGSRKWIQDLPKDLPILLLSGKEDPESGYGKAARALASRLKREGFCCVTCKVYPRFRHQVLMEKDRREVYRYLLKWLNDVLEYGFEKG